MKPFFADSWFFLALISTDDEAHEDVHEFAASLDRRVMTSDWIVVEVADALSSPARRHGYGALRHLLAEQDRYSVIRATRSQVQDGSDLYIRRPDKSWSLTDCISFVLMKKHGLVEALTFDHHFSQAGFKAVFSK